MIGFASDIAIANPIPSTPVVDNLTELIPITSPYWFIKAPPELPELMAASVCNRL